MIRLVIMLVCLAVGFGVGVYWGVHHPVEAQKLASAEEKQFVEKQKVLLEKVKRKLEQLASSQSTTGGGTGPAAGRSGFIGVTRTGGGQRDPELEDLKRESDQQLQEANKLLQSGK